MIEAFNQQITRLVDLNASGRFSLTRGPQEVLVANLSGFVEADLDGHRVRLLQEGDGANLGKRLVANFGLKVTRKSHVGYR